MWPPVSRRRFQYSLRICSETSTSNQAFGRLEPFELVDRRFHGYEGLAHSAQTRLAVGGERQLVTSLGGGEHQLLEGVAQVGAGEEGQVAEVTSCELGGDLETDTAQGLIVVGSGEGLHLVGAVDLFDLGEQLDGFPQEPGHSGDEVRGEADQGAVFRHPDIDSIDVVDQTIELPGKIPESGGRHTIEAPNRSPDFRTRTDSPRAVSPSSGVVLMGGFSIR